jgi:hypothetical protein
VEGRISWKGRQVGSTRLDAAAVALMTPADSSPELIVLLTEPEAPESILIDLHGHRSAFVRIRRGPIAHGVIESYREREPGDRAVRTSRAVTERTHRLALLPDAGRMFGSSDARALVPLEDGEPYPELGIPANPVGRPHRVVLRRVDALAEPTYALVDELDDEGWTCPVCGRVTPNPEPHTAEHGVPGHVRAGILPGEPLDETRAYAAY